jgi:flagellar L-ring protein FlgH
MIISLTSSRSRLIQTLMVMIAACNSVHAQSLYLTQAESESTPDLSQPTIYVEETSLFFIQAPEARIIREHDIITIIIDETSSTTSSQKLETEKESKTEAQLDAVLDLMELLELRLREGDTTNVNLIDFDSSREFTGEGDYERSDRFSARITAKVLEVKPNGTFVLEATKRIAKDSEISTLVLSGLARDADITSQNTILSSQLADLNIALVNEGDVKRAAEKGLVTRVLDAVFAF